MESAAGGWTGKMYSVCQWISRLAYINLLWLLFSMLGLFIGGTAPATVAMFTVVRKWMQKELSIPVFESFWHTYKKEFKNANKLGFVVFFIIAFLYVDWRIISALQSSLYFLLMGLLLGALFLFVVLLMYLLPVYVHYEQKTLQYFKIAFLVAISHPLQTMAMMLGVVLAVVIGIVFTGIGLLFFASGICWILMYFSYQVFYKMDELREAV